MDILAYEYILQGLKDFNQSCNKPYKHEIVEYPTNNTKYPITVFKEIRNIANSNYNSNFDRVSSVGYRADVFAQTKGNITKQTIARECAKLVDKYLTYIGLTRVSFNVDDNVGDGSLYHIIMTYSGNLHENRRKLI